MIKSISIKLIFSIWLAVSFFIVLISIYDYQAKEHYLKERQHKEIISSGNRLQLSLPRSIWNFNNDLTELILDSERELEYVSDIILIESSDSDISNDDYSDEYVFNLTYNDNGENTIVGRVKILRDDNSIKAELDNLIMLELIKAFFLISILVCLLYFLLSYMVVKPIQLIALKLEDIASGKGDLTKRIEYVSQDEIGNLAFSFNKFVDQIHNLVLDIQQSSARTNTLSNDLQKISSNGKTLLESQQEETDHLVDAIRQFTLSSQEIAINVKQTADESQLARTETKAISIVIQSSVKANESLSDHLNNATQAIDILENDVKGISVLLDVIR